MFGSNESVCGMAGNAEGALGDWTAARQHYLQAAQDSDPGLSAMYQLNYSLGAFQEGDARTAVQGARTILRRSFLGHFLFLHAMQCHLV